MKAHAMNNIRHIHLLVVALALASPACALGTALGAGQPPSQLAPAPLVTAAPSVPSELQNAVNWAATAVEIVRTIQKVEIQAYRDDRVTDDHHRTIQTAMGEFFGAAIDALTLAQDLTKTTVTRWASAQAIAALAATLLDRVDAHLPLIVKGYVDSLRAVLSLVGAPASAEGELCLSTP